MVARNHLLSSLPTAVQARLRPHLKSVQLDRQQVLFRAHEEFPAVYFPGTAFVSCVARVASGETLEVGFVGSDGVAGSAALPGVSSLACDGIVQIAGSAQRINADAWRAAVAGSAVLHEAADRFTQVLIARSMQIAVCNMFHAVEQRCLRWLLTAHDSVGRDELPLTHELLATLLGVHRPTVSQVLGALRRSGALNDVRGRIVILDRGRLQAACCECYGTMRREQKRLLGY